MLIWCFRVLSALPLWLMQGLGALAGRIAVRASPAFRRKVVDNLQTAGLYRPERVAASSSETGKAALETPFVWFRAPADFARRVRAEGLDAIRPERRGGKGLILLTPHLGCFEAAARVVAQTQPITVLYKPPKHPAMRRLVEAARTGPNLRAAPATSAGVRTLFRALKRGEAIGVLPDQVPSDGDGVWAPFFGRPAYTMTLPQRLARLTGAAVMLASGERLPRGGGWVVRFEPLPGDAAPAAVNAALEMLIRRYPDQYFWGYNRYKPPPQADSGRPASTPDGTAP